MVTVKVLFDYDAEQEDELSLKVGEIVKNVDLQDGGWWEGDLNGKRGMFPENFVEVVKEESSQPPPKPAQPQISGSGGKRAKVTFQYEPEQDDELALNVGDIIEVLDDDDEGWWKGRLNGKVGMFPSNFVEKMEGGASETSTPSETTEPKPEPEPEPEKVVDKKRPKSVVGGGMGFGLNIADLSRNKLKKVPGGGVSSKVTESKKDDVNKPVQMVPPLSHSKKEGFDKRLPPAPGGPTTTKTLQKAKVTFAYEPEQDDELNLNVGDIIVITNETIFEGWMEGELEGKKGVFPDNFVELLPLEYVHDLPGLNLPRDISSKKSVKRPSKEDPSKANSLGKKQSPPLLPPGAAHMKQELEKKMNKPPPPESKKPMLNKGPAPPPPASKKPKPGLPSAPKPAKPPAPVTNKPREPPSQPAPPPVAEASVATAARLGEAPRSSSVSGSALNKPSNILRSQSESIKRHEFPPARLPEENGGDKDLDLDVVKPTDPLKHVTRAKPPSKNPPSKFKSSIRHVSPDKEDGKALSTPADSDVHTTTPSSVTSSSSASSTSSGNSEEITGLKKQVTDLQTKMLEMEKKFKKLMLQVTEDLDAERKNRLNQQVEIDRLKKQISILSEN